jgi:SAM-dependent methyltransferase
VVTTRSVLIYVADKDGALREFHRVLRPGGRISLFEPINRLQQEPGRFYGYDVRPVAPLASKVIAFYQSTRPPGDDPMLDFDDRDLVRQAEAAGFPEIDLEVRFRVRARNRRARGSSSSGPREIRSSRRSARPWTGRSARLRSRSSPPRCGRWSRPGTEQNVRYTPS